MLNHQGAKPIQTERLYLRKYKAEDAPDIFQNYAADERVTKFLSWPPYADIAGVDAFVAAQIANDAQDTYNWVIEYDQQAVGSISAIQIDHRNECCEIGYCLGHAFWNQGMLTEALSAVLRYLFCEIGFYRIFAKHDVENPASGKVMMKCNMVYEGRLRAHYLRRDGTRSDSLLYSILTDEFNPAT